MNTKSAIKTILPFLISSICIYVGLYFATPFFLDKGMHFISAYFIFFHIPLFLLLILSFIYYRKEGNRWNLKAFKARLHLKKMEKEDWIWTIGLFLIGITFYLGLSGIGKKVAEINFFSPPDFFPSELNPNKESVTGIMFGYALKGKYRIIPIYFFAWLTNILGEEFLFRGIIFCKQQNKRSWMFHSILWTLWHFFWKWNLFSILPFSIALYYVFNRKRNLWITIIAHGLMNIIPFFIIIIQVFK